MVGNFNLFNLHKNAIHVIKLFYRTKESFGAVCALRASDVNRVPPHRTLAAQRRLVELLELAYIQIHTSTLLQVEKGNMHLQECSCTYQQDKECSWTQPYRAIHCQPDTGCTKPFQTFCRVESKQDMSRVDKRDKQLSFSSREYDKRTCIVCIPSPLGQAALGQFARLHAKVVGGDYRIGGA